MSHAWTPRIYWEVLYNIETLQCSIREHPEYTEKYSIISLWRNTAMLHAWTPRIYWEVLYNTSGLLRCLALVRGRVPRGSNVVDKTQPCWTFKSHAWICTFNRAHGWMSKKKFPPKMGRLKRPQICIRKRAHCAKKTRKKADPSVLPQKALFFSTFSEKN